MIRRATRCLPLNWAVAHGWTAKRSTHMPKYGPHGAFAIGIGALGRDHHDRDRAIRRMVLEEADQLEPVDVGHVDVRDDEVVRGARQEPQRVEANGQKVTKPARLLHDAIKAERHVVQKRLGKAHPQGMP